MQTHRQTNTQTENVPVMIHQHVDNILEHLWLFGAEVSSADLIHNLSELRQAVIVLSSIIATQTNRDGQIDKVRYRNIETETENQKPCINTHLKLRTKSLCKLKYLCHFIVQNIYSFLYSLIFMLIQTLYIE